MRRIVRLGLVLAAALTIGGATAMSAAADGGGKTFDSKLVGLPASMTGQTLFGVKAGGAPWRLHEGRAKLFSDGRINVRVDNLVLNLPGNTDLDGTNPLRFARAIVTCAGAIADASGVVDYSPSGDAEIHDTVSLPQPCVAPAVFFAASRVRDAPAETFVWFAVTGL